MSAPALDDPLRLDGELDPPINRWLWLVKWLLVIPHIFVLAFLWIAFIVLWLVALVAILFTGRYPRTIFDFVMGMNRWVFRVGVYAALMTDAYPPFRLDMGTHEPASEVLPADPLPPRHATGLS